MSADLNGWQAVCPMAELLPGEHTVCFDGDTAILVCNIDGEIYALEDKCTHQDFELSPGKLDGAEIECVLHGARFDVRTGQALCAPAYAPVPKFPVRIDNGMIYTRDDR
ncbi:non-heme iron oxygenase ferredoxin subunit [Arenimonas sp. GDDSR-1]|uniref:non-heme iron oxygenase ferredoxin subunit n=1 Tax=Arenimonas sp. GDDSR-1 TaxID=2950125 RepID=UPI002624F1D5|nr:non-heme iron oxygenase ferredoxin subunit [Arenimonas sp. GDDSR-1]